MTTWLGTDAFGLRRPPDVRLLLPAVMAWLTALGALAAPPRLSWACSVVAGGAAIGVYLRARPRSEPVALTLVAALACSATVAAVTGAHVARATGSAASRVAALEREAEFAATVRTDPRSRAGAPRPGRAEWVMVARTAWVRVDGRRTVSSAQVVVLASGPRWNGLLPGQEFRARGVFLPSEGDPLTSALVLVRGPPEAVTRPSGLQALAGRVRAGLREAASALPQPERGLLPALVVGDVRLLREDTAEDFRSTGMAHLLTVSGSNLAVLTGFVLGLARWLRAPVWCSVAGGAVMIWLFVLVCRPEPSVVRAAFMGSLALLALATGRAHAALGALSLTVLGVLFVAPGLAVSYGFTLSVLATAGILAFVPSWTRMWSRWLPQPVADAVAVAVAAQVAVAPVLVLLSAEVSWVAVPANVLAAPVVATVTVAGFVLAALSVLWPTAAAVAAHPPGWGVAWIAWVAETGAGVPHGALPWRSDAVGALVLAGILLILVSARGWLLRVAAAIVVAVLLLFLAVRCVPGDWPPQGWDLVACDVGQGDGFVLSAGAGSAIVADTGEDPAVIDACLTRLGVREVPLLVLSHDHADHVDGTPGVLRHRRVGAALVPHGFGDTAMGRALAEDEVELWAGRRGQSFRVGPWLLRVLWPPPGYAGSVNDGSVVVRADGASLSVLLTGDIEEQAQRRMLAGPDAGLLPVTVLTAPHHGANTQDPDFLAATEPVVTVTSVGEDNAYGHPSPYTWALLERLGRINLRTDRDGDVAVLDGGGTGPVRVVARGPAPGR
ncbi:competence protein ComEC [Nocardiopsis sp. CNR-923]|uniref:ComEC/Rec2 family competence protein n=1 Tax=Nocardiopsis sp. CNR-923 TaxID=1904965 RepID=UPI00095AAA80|nr:ComEC/Rec2 family competence protein [Nocardiopsis sp. CNR-923]OLT27486.1 competence protein ComEC [Nocardiopsis sp. CNR-923]